MDTIRRRFRNSPPKSIHKSPTPRRPYPQTPLVTTRYGGPVPISLSFKNDESSSVDDVPLIQLKSGRLGDDDGNRWIDLMMLVELDQRAAMAGEEYEWWLVNSIRHDNWLYNNCVTIYGTTIV